MQNRKKVRRYERVMVSCLLKASSNTTKFKGTKTKELLKGKRITKRIKIGRSKYVKRGRTMWKKVS